MIGKTLAHYEIVALLGKGGMGEVYRARDTKLDRDVALKVLPPHLSEDPERVARFQREARTLASLQHANIASIYGFENTADARFLVMELVGGEDLAERLEHGAVPLDDAIAIATQIATGLEAAHGQGIVHRDLKPANVKLDTTGKVKILDFGLARAYADTVQDEDDLLNSPTITAAMTRAGVILGTAAYMSPEQAKGKSVDWRSDIWSFGVILFELLAGRRLFSGETVSETMADVMKSEIAWHQLPTDTPPWLVHLLERCLDRDPGTRLQSIGEARIALQRGEAGAGATARQEPAAADVTSRRSWLPVAAAVLAVALAVAWYEFRPQPAATTAHFQLVNPHVANLRQGGRHPVAVSPDGMRFVTVGASSSETMLYLRRLDSFAWQPIAGTEDAGAPTFSPDGRWLIFSEHRSLWKVSLSGGAPIKLMEASGVLGGVSWADDGFIYGVSGLEMWRLPAAGGPKEVIYTLGEDLRGPIGRPCALPGSRFLLFHTGGEGVADLTQIHSLDLESGTLTDLPIVGTDPRYVSTGALLVAQNGQILAVRFDPDRLEVEGAPIPILDRVWVDQDGMQLDISSNGTVAYLPNLGSTVPRLLVVDRKGVSRDLVSNPLPFSNISDPRLSPDGTRLALTANRLQLWMVDLPTETPIMLSESSFYPVWSPDGSMVTYGSSRNRSYDLYEMPVDQSQPERLLLDWDHNLRTAEMSPDGALLFREEIPGKGMDLRIWHGDDPDSTQPLLEGPDDELGAAVSPDGRWLAFLSDQSGQDEIYVTAFPQPRGRIQISSGGGTSPAWGKDSREIFYMRGDTMMSVRLTTDGGMRVVSREELFTGPYLQYRWQRQYDVMPDGDHFLMILNPPRGNIEVITNWFPQLEKALAQAE